MESNNLFITHSRIVLMSVLLLIAHCLLPTECNAQTWNEWFKQKKTQRKYLAKQIVLLQVYLGYVKKGYDIASNGLNTIHNIKNGDFNLHRDFFGSLKNVNPHIVNSAKVADIMAFQVYILRDIRKVNEFCKSNNQFTPREVRYVAQVYSNMLFLTDASISELLMIIRSNQTEMKDDERLMRIDKLYDDMVDKHAFVKAFDNDVHVLAKARQQEQRETESLRKQYEII